jgi:hypothetical protein
VSEVALLSFGQPGQFDPVSLVGGQVPGLDSELQHGAHELVGLSYQSSAEARAHESHRSVYRQAADPHLKVIEPDFT